MKAVILKENGGPENLKLAEMPVPELQPGEVLIRVKDLSVNPVDASVRQNSGMLHNMLKPADGKDSYILGWDISGTVEKTGSAVTTFQTGDAVFGMVNFAGNGKAYAEYVAAPADQLARKPDNISHEEAAAATLAALTAWQALVKNARVNSGDKVLIHAASGGVGHYAVQIAKYFGAYVIGTASAANRDFVLKLGADEFIDYTSEKFENKVCDADIVIDSIGGDHVLRSIDTLRKGGKLICLKGSVEGEIENKAKEKDIHLVSQLVRSNGDDMQQLARLLEEGKIHSHISKTFHFDQLPDAHRQIETRKTVGKIVVAVE